MWLTVYLCGWLFATIGALAVAERVSGGESPSAHVSLGVGVVAGALWPVVIAGLCKWLRSRSLRGGGEPWRFATPVSANRSNSTRFLPSLRSEV
jgi:hypothetical protein